MLQTGLHSRGMPSPIGVGPLRPWRWLATKGRSSLPICQLPSLPLGQTTLSTECISISGGPLLDQIHSGKVYEVLTPTQHPRRGRQFIVHLAEINCCKVLKDYRFWGYALEVGPQLDWIIQPVA